MPRLAFALAVAVAGGCSYTLHTLPPLKVPAPRAVSLQLDVAGRGRAAFDEMLEWVLRGNGLIRRVPSGGDAHYAIDADLDRSSLVLGGTDLALTVRLHGDGLDETRRWKRIGLTNGVPGALEDMTSDAAVWALARAAAASALATPPAAPPPVEVAPAAPPPVVETPSPPPPARKRKHRR